MLMTADEAQTKWCPFARLSQYHSDGGVPGTTAACAVNRTDTDLPVARCLASECAAWSWFRGDQRQPPAHFDDQKLEELGYALDRIVDGTKFYRKEKPRGYCGLIRQKPG